MIGRVRSAFAWRRQGERERRDDGNWDFSPQDRIGAMPRRSHSRRAVRWCVAATAVAVVAYVSYQDPVTVTRTWSFVSKLASSLMVSELGRGIAPAPSPEYPARTAETPLPARPLEASPSTESGQRIGVNDAAPANAAPLHPPEKTADAPAKSRLAIQSSPMQAPVPYAPPELATVEDPYEVKAKAAGLHPDLSRVLLKELTDADYRNARVATETALAKTADDGVFRWPKKREPGLAMFEVRFVPGASDTCRRYIVTIEKNHWLTTSSPIEKCGVGPIKRRAEINLPG